MRGPQRGIALITAILIVALVATVAASLAFGQQVWLRQTQNLVDLATAERLRLSAAEHVAYLVVQDLRSNQVDHLDERWAIEDMEMPLKIRGLSVRVTVEDAQRRLNLNNIVAQQTASPGGPSNVPPERQMYLRLLTSLRDYPDDPERPVASLRTDPEKVHQLVNALVDWIDNDSLISGPGGAEDADYLGKEPPHRAANQALTSVDELLLVEGYDREIVNALRPHVIALPGQAPTPININTARGRVLYALLPGMKSLDDASAIEKPKGLALAEHYKDKAAFDAATAMFGNRNGNYDVSTNYFIVRVTVSTDRIERITETLIHRASQGARILGARQVSPEELANDEESDETES